MQSHIVPAPLVRASFVVAWIAVLSGCSITSLQHDPLDVPQEQQTGVVGVETKATGFTGGRVGWGRITVFYIPVVPIHIQSDESRDLIAVIENALATAGYETRAAEALQAGPVLRAHVDKARFNNYTWLAPIVPTWGRLDVTLTLESANGEVVWEQSFNGRGTTLNFFDGYNIAATKTVTRLANSMVEAFTGPEFSDAVSGGS